jgi:hypothetical protein
MRSSGLSARRAVSLEVLAEKTPDHRARGDGDPSRGPASDHGTYGRRLLSFKRVSSSAGVFYLY